jgi:O-antigen ligase
MSSLLTHGDLGRLTPNASEALYRAARVCLLSLAAVVCFGPITAVRETLVIIAALFMAGHLYLSSSARLRATVLFWPFIIYLLTALFSLLSAVDPAYSLSELRGELLKGILLYYTAVHFVERPENLGQVWLALLVGAFLMTASGALLPMYDLSTIPGNLERAGSLADGYQYFATYLVLVWPFVLLAPMAFRRTWLRLALCVLVPLAAYSAYLTQSRAAWLALAVQAGLVLLLLSHRRLLAVSLGLAFCAGVVTAVLFIPGLNHGEDWTRLTQRPEKIGGTAGDLICLWKHASQEIKKHPFQGIGLGRDSFMKTYPDFIKQHHPLLWHSHNLFVEQALHLGLQGLAAFLLVLGALLVKLWPRARPKQGDVAGLFSAAATAMIVGFCLRNFTDNLFVDDPALLFWLLCGLAMGGHLAVGRGRKS